MIGSLPVSWFPLTQYELVVRYNPSPVTHDLPSVWSFRTGTGSYSESHFGSSGLSRFLPVYGHELPSLPSCDLSSPGVFWTFCGSCPFPSRHSLSSPRVLWRSPLSHVGPGPPWDLVVPGSDSSRYSVQCQTEGLGENRKIYLYRFEDKSISRKTIRKNPPIFT